MLGSTDSKGISVAVDQNEYLGAGAGTVDAVVTVEVSSDLMVTAPPQERVEILIIDCSGSMGTGHKFEGARSATLAALEKVSDGTQFAIVEGTHVARSVFPTKIPSVRADRRSRAAARRALNQLRPHGGTAMGTWLGQARQLATQHPGAMVHAILLTDGKNEHEEPETLAGEIKLSEGMFTCDCRGVGTDWRVDEVRSISSALHGTVDIVRDPANLAADFAAMMQTSMAKAIRELKLRVWTPRGARVQFVKQVAPTIEDLTGRRAEFGPQVGEYSLGAWGVENRDYHLQVWVEPAAPGREKLAARSVCSRGSRYSARGWFGRCGPPTPRCRPGSADASRTTPGRPSWRRRCGTGWRRERTATPRARPRSCAGRWSWPRSPATRARRSCCAALSRSTSAPGPCGCGRTWTRQTRWPWTLGRPRRRGYGRSCP